MLHKIILINTNENCVLEAAFLNGVVQNGAWLIQEQLADKADAYLADISKMKRRMGNSSAYTLYGLADGMEMGLQIDFQKAGC